jgi:ureidoacrylate peracid hydrolase
MTEMPAPPLTSLAEKVFPQHTAIIAIDLQRDFMLPGLFSDRIGQDISAMPALAKRIATFLDVARGNKVRIIHVRADYAPKFMSPPMWERLRRHGVDPYCQPGTEGIEFFPGLEPPAGEEVITKHRFDAFFGTDLDDRLRDSGIRTVIVLGVATHCCVDATARHAYFLDYYVVFGSDLTGGADSAMTEATLRTMEQCFGVVATSEEIAEAWSG